MVLTLVVLGKSKSKWLESKFGKGEGLCAVLSWEKESCVWKSSVLWIEALQAWGTAALHWPCPQTASLGYR